MSYLGCQKLHNFWGGNEVEETNVNMRQKNETDFSKAKNEEKQNECFLFTAKFCNLFEVILRIEI